MAGQPEILDYIKLSMRIRTETFDEELRGLIAACKLDLKNSGVIRADEKDELVRQAIKLYCKAYFGFEERAEQFAKAYEALKQSLSLSGDYNNVDGAGNQDTGVHDEQGS